MRPDRGAARLARTIAFALACLTLAAGAHAMGAGGLPRTAMLILVMPPVLLLSLWLSGRRRRPALLFGVLSIVQAVLHLAFHVADAAVVSPLTADVHAGHRHAIRPTTDTVALATAVHGSVVPSTPMMLWHLAATLLTGWVMARGERTVWGLAHRLRVRLLPTPRVARPVPSPPAAVPAACLCLFTGWYGRVVGPRGPPVTCVI